MATCDKLISGGISFNCTSPLVKGVEATGIIINKADIETITYTSVNEISGITLSSGKKAYNIVQAPTDPFTGTNSTLDTSTVLPSFTHVVSFTIIDNGPEVGEMVDNIAGGEFVVILENKGKKLSESTNAGNSAYQVYGTQGGLKMTSGESDKYSTDTLSGWAVELTEEQVPTSAVYIYNTDYETTKSMVNSLV